MRLSEFLGLGSGGKQSIIAGVVAETGETLVAGDMVGLNFNGKAVKLVNADVAVVAVAKPTNFFSYAVTDQLMVIVACYTSLTQAYVYDGTTNTLSAAVTLTSSATAGHAFDAVQLDNGNIVVAYGDNTNIFFATLSSTGTLVSNSTAKIAYASVSSPTTNKPVLVKGFAAGSFFCLFITGSSTLTCNLYDSAYTLTGGTTSTTTIAGYTTRGELVGGWTVIRGAASICIFICNGAAGNFGYSRIIDGTTGALIGTETNSGSASGNTYTAICGFVAGTNLFYLAGVATAGQFLYHTRDATTGATGTAWTTIATGISSYGIIAQVAASQFITATTSGTVTGMQVIRFDTAVGGWAIYSALPQQLPTELLELGTYKTLGNGFGRSSLSQLRAKGDATANGEYYIPAGSYASVTVDAATVGTSLLPRLQLSGYVNSGNAIHGSLRSISAEYRVSDIVCISSKAASILGEVTLVGTSTVSVDASIIPDSVMQYNGAAYNFRGRGVVAVNNKLYSTGG